MKKLIQLPHKPFKDDPNWITPLNMQANPSKNPFFEHGEPALFTAWENGESMASISAYIDQVHLQPYGDSTGFSGSLILLKMKRWPVPCWGPHRIGCAKRE